MGLDGLHATWWRLRALLERRRLDRDLEAELAFHLHMREAQLRADGCDAGAARAAARRQFGNPARLKERCRDMWTFTRLEELWHDLRLGARMLRRSPGFAAVAVLSLALGIGANAAIFSVVDAVLLRPLPYRDSSRIMMIWGSLRSPGLEKLEASAPEVEDYRARLRSCERVEAYASHGVNLTGDGDPERVPAAEVSGGLFSLLGARPLLGRTFLPGEERPGGDRVVLLSHGFWQRRFASSPAAAGKSLTLDGKSVTIVGVMPAGFHFPDPDTELWVPLVFTPDLLSENNRGSHYLSLLARLRPGVSPAQARADLATVAGRIGREHAANYPLGFAASLVPLRREVVGDAGHPLLVLWGAIGLVLLIACVNVASLLLARASARQQEVALRMALGASRGRLIRQLVAESLLLGAGGGLLGLLAARWSVALLVRLAASDLPRAAEIHLDLAAAAFTCALSLLSVLLFGLVPAMQGSVPDLQRGLRESGRGVGASRRHRRLRESLVVAELSFALVLLVGAGLLTRSFLRLEQVRPGFQPEGLLTLRLSLPETRYPGFLPRSRFYGELLSRLAADPRVSAAGAINGLPFSGYGGDRSFSIEGLATPPGGAGPDEQLRFVSPDYFRAAGMRLLRGRGFGDRDSPAAPRVVVVNQALVDRYGSGRIGLGKRLAFGGDEGKPAWCTVVGVVGNVREEGLDAAERPEIYLPISQPLFSLAKSSLPPMFLVIRTAADPAALVPEVRRAVAALDRDLPLTSVRTMEQRIDESVAPRRFHMCLLVFFAAIALLLAAVGTYGVIAYAVQQRRHEIGIRIAIGAGTGAVLGMVMARGARLALAGVGIGVVAGLALTRSMASLLYGVTADDPPTFIAVASLLCAVALLASFIPARRATAVDPLLALRQE
jgi:predicted permease